MPITARSTAMLGVALLSLAACIPLPNDLGGDDDPASSATGTASGTAGGTPTATSTSDGADATGDDIDDETRLDMNLDPLFPPCDAVGPSTVIVTSAQTSNGPLPVAHAVYGWDYCCYRKPRLVLTVDPPAPEGFDVLSPPDYVEVIALHEDPDAVDVDDYSGVVQGAFQDDGEDSPSGPRGSFEFLDPLDATPDEEGFPDLTQRLHARVTLAAEGWNFDVEVEADHCGAYDLPSCPCE